MVGKLSMTASARAHAIEPFTMMAALEQVRKLEATNRDKRDWRVRLRDARANYAGSGKSFARNYWQTKNRREKKIKADQLLLF